MPTLLSRGRTSRSTLALTAVLALAALSGCGTGEDTSNAGSSPTADVAVDEAAAAMLPASIADAGTLSLVSDFAYPPYALRDDSGNLGGSDYELMNAVAARLGLEPEWTVSIGFSTLVPAVQNGRADVAVESIAITDERLGAVSFVAYQTATDYMVVAAGNPAGLDPSDICGSSLATQSGAVEQGLLEDLSTECVAAGREPIEQAFFSDNTSALQAVVSGQAEGLAEGLAAATVDTESSEGTLEMLDESEIKGIDGVSAFSSYTLGIAVGRDEDGMALGRAIQQVLADMQADGSYDEIMAPYGLDVATFPAQFVSEPGELQ